jgi:hypothetical protein
MLYPKKREYNPNKIKKRIDSSGVPLKAPHLSQNAPHMAYFFSKNAL